MTRILFLCALAGWVVVCGGAPVDQGGPMVVTYYQGGEARLAAIDSSCQERIPELLRELVGEGEPLRLLVSEDRLEEIRTTLEAVEVVLPEALRLSAANGNDILTRRVLVPLDGERYVGDEERPFVTVFLGDEAYRSGPLMAPTGRPLALELRTCATGG